MPWLLSVDAVAFTILGYPLSWIELVGTLLYLWSVWLISRRRILTWPVGIASVILYAILFYQIRLYADVMEQVYYFAISIYGWLRWNREERREEGVPSGVSYSGTREGVAVLAVTAVLSVLLGVLVSRMHTLVPGLFPEPASYPWLDAATTMMSFTAMWLMARKRVESWYYWIIVDVVGIGLYYAKDVRFVALLYVVLLVMAINGAIAWRRALRSAEGPSLR